LTSTAPAAPASTGNFSGPTRTSPGSFRAAKPTSLAVVRRSSPYFQPPEPDRLAEGGAFFVQPAAEGVQGAHPCVHRHGTDTTVSERDHELLQVLPCDRLGRVDGRGAEARPLRAKERLPGGLIPDPRLRTDVLEVGAFAEEAVEERIRGSRARRSFRPSAVRQIVCRFNSRRSWCALQDSNLRPPGS
jgi:hypothetical protein